MSARFVSAANSNNDDQNCSACTAPHTSAHLTSMGLSQPMFAPTARLPSMAYDTFLKARADELRPSPHPFSFCK